MKIPRAPHRWSLSPAQAMAVQRQLADAVRIAAPPGPLRRVAGLDAAFSRDAERCIAGVVVWDVRARAVVERRVATRRLRFPYVPGLLSFREAPALLAALRRLRQRPDALLCDGHGLAHPRRFGIACHIGVLTGLPTIGCAKSRLVGSHRTPATRRGARATLEDGGEIVGCVLRTRSGVKPVFVSVGHRIDLATAVRLVLDCAVAHRLPEPTRLADRLVAEAKRRAAHG
ncbi:MAG: deoxyribonuclease V [Deltaproteobacteria bacterium]|nr:MAG: deoxyribonuclease V [Deltaproteobacteria bacterium]